MKQAHSRPTTSCAVLGKTIHVALSGRTCVVNVGQSEAGGSSVVAEELTTTRVPLNGQRCGRLWAVKAKSKVAAEVMSQEQDEKVRRPRKLGSRVCKAGSGLLSQAPSECYTALGRLDGAAQSRLNQWWCYSVEQNRNQTHPKLRVNASLGRGEVLTMARPVAAAMNNLQPKKKKKKKNTPQQPE
ncbi:unnamed protein product [Camellia sinensis]